MEARDFSAVTPEIEALAAKSRENNRIDISLYDKYEVKRGLRDLNGKGFRKSRHRRWMKMACPIRATVSFITEDTM